jgi:hypothetical protein
MSDAALLLPINAAWVHKQRPYFNGHVLLDGLGEDLGYKALRAAEVSNVSEITIIDPSQSLLDGIGARIQGHVQSVHKKRVNLLCDHIIDHMLSPQFHSVFISVEAGKNYYIA